MCIWSAGECLYFHFRVGVGVCLKCYILLSKDNSWSFIDAFLYQCAHALALGTACVVVRPCGGVVAAVRVSRVLIQQER